MSTLQLSANRRIIQAKSPKVSIIILNWNGWQDTLECLDSLINVIYPNYEVIVVDNGSTNESLAKLKAKNPFEFAQGKEKLEVGAPFDFAQGKQSLKIIENKENLGFAGGNNVGIKYALENDADYVLLLNNDTLASETFLSELLAEAEKNKTFGLFGPKIYFWPRTSPERIWFMGGKINWLKTKGVHVNYDAKENSPAETGARLIETDYITGCGLLIRREVIKKIGTLSDDYFLYYEDTDYCLKARVAGWKCGIVPSARIWHKVSRSAKEFSPSYLYYHARNGLLMAKRNNPWEKIIILYPFSFYLVLKQIIKYLFIPRKKEWAKMTMRGIYDFYMGKTGKIDVKK